MLWVTPVYVYAVSNISMGFRIGVGVFESRGTVLYGVRVFYLPYCHRVTNYIIVAAIVFLDFPALLVAETKFIKEYRAM